MASNGFAHSTRTRTPLRQLIDTRRRGKVVRSFDMPLQHINDRVLKRMIHRVDRARPAPRSPTQWPGLAMHHVHRRLRRDRCGVRGSPVRRGVKFELAGVFPYSLEPDTQAERLDGHLPEAVNGSVASIMTQRLARSAGLAPKSEGTKPDRRRTRNSQITFWANLRRFAGVDCVVRVKEKPAVRRFRESKCLRRWVRPDRPGGESTVVRRASIVKW